MCRTRKKWVLEWCALTIVGRVAARSRIKKPFKYEKAMSIASRVFFSSRMVMKLPQISKTQTTSHSHTNDHICSYKCGKTYKYGVVRISNQNTTVTTVYHILTVESLGSNRNQATPSA